VGANLLHFRVKCYSLATIEAVEKVKRRSTQRACWIRISELAKPLISIARRLLQGRKMVLGLVPRTVAQIMITRTMVQMRRHRVRWSTFAWFQLTQEMDRSIQVRAKMPRDLNSSIHEPRKISRHHRRAATPKLKIPSYRLNFPLLHLTKTSACRSSPSQSIPSELKKSAAKLSRRSLLRVPIISVSWVIQVERGSIRSWLDQWLSCCSRSQSSERLSPEEEKQRIKVHLEYTKLMRLRTLSRV